MIERQKSSGTAARAGIFGALALVLVKFKFAILAALKAAPLLKLGWILKGSWTILLSLGLYTMLYGWRFAAALIALIYVHEMGHYIFMKVKGLNPKAPVFVPFLGAYVAMTNVPRDPVLQAWVAYAGPLIGGLGAALLGWLGQQTGQQFLIGAASMGFVINLLQLVPIRPFDGGFIADCISKWLAIPGVILLVFVSFAWHSPLLMLISLPAGISAIGKLRAAPPPELQAVSLPDRARVTVAYFWLAWALGWCYWQTMPYMTALRGN